MHRNIVKIGKIDTPSTQIHGGSLSWLFGTGTSTMKCGGVKLVLWAKSSPLSSHANSFHM